MSYEKYLLYSFIRDTKVPFVLASLTTALESRLVAAPKVLGLKTVVMSSLCANFNDDL